MAYDTSKLAKLAALQALAQRAEATYVKQTDFDSLKSTVDGIVSTGGEANVLEGVKVNGTALEITDKLVDVLIATGTTDGTIAVNGIDVSVAGYASLVTTVEGKADAATTLAGYGITDGMTATEIASAISEAIAGADHLKRTIVASTDAIDLTADDADQYVYMVANADGGDSNSYDEYMVINGALEKVGDWAVDLSDYATTAAVTTAIETALTDYAKTDDVNSAISTAVESLITLSDLSVTKTGEGNVVTAVAYDSETGVITVTKGITAVTDDQIATDDEVTEMLDEIYGATE